MSNNLCPVINGNWGPWGESPCNQDSCKGTLNRARACNNPPPANGGTDCTTANGSNATQEEENDVPCNQDMDNCPGIFFST